MRLHGHYLQFIRWLRVGFVVPDGDDKLAEPQKIVPREEPPFTIGLTAARCYLRIRCGGKVSRKFPLLG